MNNQYYNSRWMTDTPAIDNLSLNELSLPGTHNAGSDWKASYSVPIIGPHWLACQHDRFYQQLLHGSRALDIRLIANPAAKGLGQFQIHHNGYVNSRSLADLITDVNRFLDENPDEFIILDFHKTDGEKFDYAYFSQVMIELLGHRLIPARYSHYSLNELKRLGTRQRVLAAVDYHSGIDSKVFIDGIRHKWSGEGITNASELHKFITEVMENRPGTWAPWSLSATSYSLPGGPVDIHNELNKWFDPATSDWAWLCNIINVDFIEETKLVGFCRTVNLIKADQRRRTGA